MSKLTTERLEYYAALPTKPVAYRNKFTGQFFTLEQQPDAVTDTDVYEPVFLAAPVLPKQPESRNEIMAKGVEAFAKDWKGSARYSRISEMACNFAAKLRNGDADEC